MLNIVRKKKKKIPQKIFKKKKKILGSAFQGGFFYTDLTSDEETESDLGEWRRDVRGASKIKLKKVNKKRTVRVRRVIIFMNISRHPLLI